MSMISEQILFLRDLEGDSEIDMFGIRELQKAFKDAADTIEELSTKLANANMERSTAYYNDGWILVEDGLPSDDSKEYLAQKKNGIIDILGFARDAYKLDRYDFAEYRGKKKPIFYDYDSECGYIELECVAWRELPTPYQPKEKSNV